MAKGIKGNVIGKWAFLAGFVLAVLLGLFAGDITPIMMYALVILGLVVGFLNVADREVNAFLMSGAILVIVASLGKDVVSGIPYLEPVLSSLLILFIPATIIVAVKHVFSLARN